MTTGIKIELSDNAVKAVVAGAVLIGFMWWVYKLVGEDPDESLPIEAKTFARLPEVTPSRLDEIQYDAGIKEQVRKLFENRHYPQAVFEAVKALLELIKIKTGLREKDGRPIDGAELVEYAFNEKRVITFRNIQQPELGNVEKGFIGLLQYLTKTVRNTHAHQTAYVSEADALRDINIACFLAYQIKHNSVVLLSQPSPERKLQTG